MQRFQRAEQQAIFEYFMRNYAREEFTFTAEQIASRNYTKQTSGKPY
jgi:hypothetical protein